MKLFERTYSFFKIAKNVYLSNKSTYGKYSHDYDKFLRWKKSLRRYLVCGTSLFIYITFKLKYSNKHNAHLKGAYLSETFRPDLPNYTKKEVLQNAKKGINVWVYHNKGVYDITNYVPLHPGGNQILLATGSSITPFWKVYPMHNTLAVNELLETFRIGNLVDDNNDSGSQNVTDPFSNEPTRHTVFVKHSIKPWNSEPPLDLLGKTYLTLNDFFFIRNHLPAPDLNPKNHELDIIIEGSNKNVTMNLESLKKLPIHTVTSTIICVGTRRAEMAEIKPIQLVNLGSGTIGNAQWTGVYLRDVLKSIGIDDNSNFKHVHFEAADVDQLGSPYATSIPFWKAISSTDDVLLAFEMNGEPIPRDHGFPLRAIVPGFVGARNVKWLKKIVLSQNESDSFYHKLYKNYPPGIDYENVDLTQTPTVQEYSINSVICHPPKNTTVDIEDGYIKINGWAYAGGGRKIDRVDVTIDGGRTWHVANLKQENTNPPRHWCWTLWHLRISVPKNANNIEIWCKAVDSSNNGQPEKFDNIWNLKGVVCNAYHKVPVKLKHVGK